MTAQHHITASIGSDPCNTMGVDARKPDVERTALSNAVAGDSTMNYRTILDGFSAMGISMDAIVPRVNVFTFHAWRSLGRCVRKGEHGVKVTTYIQRRRIDKSTGAIGSNKFPTTTTVFHVSQTDPLPAAAVPADEEA